MRRWSPIRVKAAITALLPVALLASACTAGSHTQRCFSADSSEWQVAMRDSVNDYQMNGVITLTAVGGTTRLVGTSRDGANEVIDYPVRNLRIHGDSAAFAFAPIDVQVALACVDSIAAEGVFARPNPPFDSLRGVVRMSRERREP